MITIQLTEEEAKVLRSVLRRVGGNPENSSRGRVKSILRILKGAGVTGNFYTPDLVGSLEFECEVNYGDM